MMNGLAVALRSQVLVETGCPDYDCDKQMCLAATSQLAPSRRQQMRYCANSDYDNCPIYLGKALRSCRTQCLARDSIVDSGK